MTTIEAKDEKTGNVIKGDLFTKRVNEPVKKINHAETAFEALGISLNEKGVVDLERIQALTGQSLEESIQELKGLIYKNPEEIGRLPRISF